MFEVLELPDGITALYQKQGKNLEVLFFKKNVGFLARCKARISDEALQRATQVHHGLREGPSSSEWYHRACRAAPSGTNQQSAEGTNILEERTASSHPAAWTTALVMAIHLIYHSPASS
ncbi:MAG TPA: hypothetical protein VGK01_11540 [Candidatus Angelobacter sp.]|jgi:hypothetical protein